MGEAQRQREHARRRSLLAVAAVAVVAANILWPGFTNALLFNACFWSIFAALLHTQSVGWRDGAYLLPLPVLYYLTFAGRRELASGYDMVLGADAARYLEQSADLTVGVRHLGYAVITWPRTAVSWLGGPLGLERWGADYLYLQSAVTGGIAVVLLARILREVGMDRWPRLAIAYAFGLSLSVWLLAAVVDPQIFSTMVLLLLLLNLQRYLRFDECGETAAAVPLVTSTPASTLADSCAVDGEASSRVTFDGEGPVESTGDGRSLGAWRWLEPCAICLLAATMSIENLYMPVLFATAWWVRGRAFGGRDLREPLLFAVTLIAALGALLPAAEMATGPQLYAVDMTRFGAPDGVVSHLGVFTSLYLEVGPGLAPAEIGRTAFQVFVMAVRAQPAVPVDRYRFSDELLGEPANWLYGGLMVALAAAAITGLRVRRGREPGFEWVLVTGLLARQLFVSVYDRWESVLFSLPSLTFLWLLLGIGIASAPLDERRKRWLAVVLAVLLALLVVSNTAYIWEVPTRAEPPM